jgi:hypothetical protein
MRDQLIKEGLVDDTSTQSINRKHGGSDHADKTIFLGTPMDGFSYKPMLI